MKHDHLPFHTTVTAVSTNPRRSPNWNSAFPICTGSGMKRRDPDSVVVFGPGPTGNPNVSDQVGLAGLDSTILVLCPCFRGMTGPSFNGLALSASLVSAPQPVAMPQCHLGQLARFSHLPTTAIVGSSIVRNVRFLNATMHCLPGATVTEIQKQTPVFTAVIPTLH